MKRHRLSILTSLVLAALSSPISADSVIYAQYPDDDRSDDNPEAPTYFGTGETSDAVGGQRNDQIIADNFTLTDSDATITYLRWWGGSDNEKSTYTDNFASITVRIFSSHDDAPDFNNVVYTGTFPFAETSPVYKGYGAAGFPFTSIVYEQKLTFAQPIKLCRGTEYWISIGATNIYPQIDDNGYVWYGPSVSFDDTIAVFTPSEIFTLFGHPVEWSLIAGDQAFELKGDPAQFDKIACPDPTPTPSPEPTPTIEPTPTPTGTSEPTPTATIDITTAPTPTATTAPKVPIPPAIWLFGSGLAGLFAAARKRKSKP